MKKDKQTIKQAIASVDAKKALFENVKQTAFRGSSSSTYELIDPLAYKGSSSQVLAIINCMVDIANKSNSPIIDNDTLLETLSSCDSFKTTQPISKVVAHYKKALSDCGVYKLV
tara:strand:+ start:1729 stop:2070 length:342 start_codon:yes stop_codon:yes gene_type:complete